METNSSAIFDAASALATLGTWGGGIPFNGKQEPCTVSRASSSSFVSAVSAVSAFGSIASASSGATSQSQGQELSGSSVISGSSTNSHSNSNANEGAASPTSMPPPKKRARKRHVPSNNPNQLNQPNNSNQLNNSNQPTKPDSHAQGAQPAQTFPEKLMNMLDYAETIKAQSEDPDNFCISWLPNGESFIVRDPSKCMKEVVARFFKQAKFTSFQRKLYRWGFHQVPPADIKDIHDLNGIGGSPLSMDAAIFANEFFKRDARQEMVHMRSHTADAPKNPKTEKTQKAPKRKPETGNNSPNSPLSPRKSRRISSGDDSSSKEGMEGMEGMEDAPLKVRGSETSEESAGSNLGIPTMHGNNLNLGTEFGDHGTNGTNCTNGTDEATKTTMNALNALNALNGGSNAAPNTPHGGPEAHLQNDLQNNWQNNLQNLPPAILSLFSFSKVADQGSVSSVSQAGQETMTTMTSPLKQPKPPGNCPLENQVQHPSHNGSCTAPAASAATNTANRIPGMTSPQQTFHAMLQAAGGDVSNIDPRIVASMFGGNVGNNVGNHGTTAVGSSAKVAPQATQAHQPSNILQNMPREAQKQLLTKLLDAYGRDKSSVDPRLICSLINNLGNGTESAGSSDNAPTTDNADRADNAPAAATTTSQPSQPVPPTQPTHPTHPTPCALETHGAPAVPPIPPVQPVPPSSHEDQKRLLSELLDAYGKDKSSVDPRVLMSLIHNLGSGTNNHDNNHDPTVSSQSSQLSQSSQSAPPPPANGSHGSHGSHGAPTMPSMPSVPPMPSMPAMPLPSREAQKQQLAMLLEAYGRDKSSVDPRLLCSLINNLGSGSGTNDANNAPTASNPTGQGNGSHGSHGSHGAPAMSTAMSTHQMPHQVPLSAMLSSPQGNNGFQPQAFNFGNSSVDPRVLASLMQNQGGGRSESASVSSLPKDSMTEPKASQMMGSPMSNSYFLQSCGGNNLGAGSAYMAARQSQALSRQNNHTELSLSSMSNAGNSNSNPAGGITSHLHPPLSTDNQSVTLENGPGSKNDLAQSILQQQLASLVASNGAANLNPRQLAELKSLLDGSSAVGRRTSMGSSSVTTQENLEKDQIHVKPQAQSPSLHSRNILSIMLARRQAENNGVVPDPSSSGNVPHLSALGKMNARNAIPGSLGNMSSYSMSQNQLQPHQQTGFATNQMNPNEVLSLWSKMMGSSGGHQA